MQVVPAAVVGIVSMMMLMDQGRADLWGNAFDVSESQMQAWYTCLMTLQGCCEGSFSTAPTCGSPDQTTLSGVGEQLLAMVPNNVTTYITTTLARPYANCAMKDFLANLTVNNIVQDMLCKVTHESASLALVQQFAPYAMSVYWQCNSNWTMFAGYANAVINAFSAQGNSFLGKLLAIRDNSKTTFTAKNNAVYTLIGTVAFNRTFIDWAIQKIANLPYVQKQIPMVCKEWALCTVKNFTRLNDHRVPVKPAYNLPDCPSNIPGNGK